MEIMLATMIAAAKMKMASPNCDGHKGRVEAQAAGRSASVPCPREREPRTPGRQDVVLHIVTHTPAPRPAPCLPLSSPPAGVRTFALGSIALR